MMNPLPPLSEIERLLVVKTSSIGDVIHALPVVETLKRAQPGLTLGWVVRARCADVLRDNPSIDRLYVIENRPSWRELSRLRGALRAARYQCALDMQGLFLSGLITALSGAPVRVGWDRNREGNALFMTHPVVPGKMREVGMRHEVDLLYGFAAALGVDSPHPDFAPQPYLAAKDRARMEQGLQAAAHPRVALNVGASRPYKQWPAESWAAVADGLLERGCGVVFVGDAGDAAIVGQIRGRMRRQDVVDASGRTSLRELAALLAACDLVVTGDTGPMHLAVAVGTPVVALFGATSPARHGPYGPRHTVLHKPVAGLDYRRRPTQEIGQACLRRIAPVDVLAAVEAILPERSARL